MNDLEKNTKYDFLVVCRLTQCLFCLSDERLPYLHRIYEYFKSNKMMNEARKHLKRFAPKNQVSCSHSQCKAAGLVLPSVMAFKNHIAIVHKIFLRAQARSHFLCFVSPLCFPSDFQGSMR